MHTLVLPAGTTARLHILPAAQAAGFPHAVVVASPGHEATPDTFAALLREHGGMTAFLTHDAGCAWTDRSGETLLVATVKRGGVAIMAFANLADAMAACRRVRGAVG